MADILFNGAPVVRATISMPRQGSWIAQVEVASATAITGRCVIDVGGTLFNGSIRRGGAWQGTCRYSVAGGANAMQNVLPSRFYSNVPASIPVRDILTEISQPISSTADNLTMFLPRWLRMEDRAVTQLQMLLDQAGATWRILGDGSLWYGIDAWPELSAAATVLDEDPTTGVMDVATDTPIMRPGVTWQGRRVSYVVHRLAPSSARTELWLE